MTSLINVHWLALLMALIATAVAQLMYKLFYLKGNVRYVIIAIVLFVTTPAFAYLALKGLGLGVVYMSTAITQVLVLLLAYFFLNEEVNRVHIVAMLFIISGVIVYAV